MNGACARLSVKDSLTNVPRLFRGVRIFRNLVANLLGLAETEFDR